MKQLLFIFLCAISTSVINAEPQLGFRIFNGDEAPKKEFPWQVGIRFLTNMGKVYRCGGALISDRWILTAAHCLADAIHFEISLGSNTLVGKDPNRVVLHSTTSIIHEDYNPHTVQNDIGLILLLQSVDFNEHLHPIRLNSDSSNVASGTIVTVSGWGHTGDNELYLPNNLNYVKLKVISYSECQRIYPKVNKGVFCAGKIGDINQDTCRGDSGGPLVAYTPEGPVHVGVVSYGTTCEAGYPSVYTKTDYYRNWIREKTGI